MFPNRSSIGLSLFIALALFISVLSPNLASAEGATELEKNTKKDAKQEGKPEEIRAGIISSSGSFTGAKSIDAADTPADMSDVVMPIRSSVSHKGNQCIATVTNSSAENSYSVRFKIAVQERSGGRPTERSFSASLKPGKSVDRSVPCSKKANVKVVLVSGKKR